MSHLEETEGWGVKTFSSHTETSTAKSDEQEGQGPTEITELLCVNTGQTNTQANIWRSHTGLSGI